MTEKSHTIDKDGSLSVVHKHGEAKIKDSNGDNHQTRIQETRWNVPPAQLEKHAPQFEKDMSSGEKSAFRDAINEHNKEAKKRKS